METLFSLSLISLGTPMTKLAMTVLLAVRAEAAAYAGGILNLQSMAGYSVAGNTFVRRFGNLAEWSKILRRPVVTRGPRRRMFCPPAAPAGIAPRLWTPSTGKS